MTTLREAAQMAVDAWFKEGGINYHDFMPYMEALRARLAQPEQDDGYCQACEGNHCTAKNGCVALDNPKAQPEQKPMVCPRCFSATEGVHTKECWDWQKQPEQELVRTHDVKSKIGDW